MCVYSFSLAHSSTQYLLGTFVGTRVHNTLSHLHTHSFAFAQVRSFTSSHSFSFLRTSTSSLVWTKLTVLSTSCTLSVVQCSASGRAAMVADAQSVVGLFEDHMETKPVPAAEDVMMYIKSTFLNPNEFIEFCKSQTVWYWMRWGRRTQMLFPDFVW